MNDRPTIVDLTPVTLEADILASHTLTQGQYERMKQVTGHWRDTLHLMMLRNTGFSPSEVETIEARHVFQKGTIYGVWMKRRKRREDVGEEAVFLNPNLGQPLVAYLKGFGMRPTDSVFGIKKRMMQLVVAGAGENAFGRRVQVKEFRRL